METWQIIKTGRLFGVCCNGFLVCCGIETHAEAKAIIDRLSKA